ncbi:MULTISPECIES: carboxymuconolactone decarboxylase family protein [Burkholderia]|uniref:carboxymuconolactone decarboxylase family protein n=1 Tax=Burkholderia TaxID=32008 RepID=UPI0009DED227|nr:MULTISPECIES: carboxymuconolactone decarboxylase family protein [Burkholderia]
MRCGRRDTIQFELAGGRRNYGTKDAGFSETHPESRRVRSILSLHQLSGHRQKAIADGVMKRGLRELLTHLAFYAGWPAAASAVNALAALPE